MKKILFIFLLISTSIHAHTVFILVHGTWAQSAAWHMPGGDFFNALEQCTKHYANIVPFRWDGSNTHTARAHAATGLVKLIQSYPQETTLRLITHSHGTNVATLASQLLGKDTNNKHTIDVFYALGTPINGDYQPDMRVINYFYNLFSFEDLIQPVLGMFRREYEAHARVANIRITIDSKEPNHTQLHDPLVASWLPQLHEWMRNKNIDLSKPGIIHFAKNQELVYEIDEKREELIARDLRLSALLLLSFRKNFNTQYQRCISGSGTV